MDNRKLIDAYAFADMWRSYAITDEQRELSERVAKSAEEFPTAVEVPDQPDTCPIYGGVCCYPIEACCECPKHSELFREEQSNDSD